MTAYARIGVAIFLVLLLGRLAWWGMHPVPHSASTVSAAHENAARAPLSAGAGAWERQAGDSLDESVNDALSGNIAAAEASVDRATSIATAARLESGEADTTFFTNSIDALDRVTQQNPRDQQLLDHVMRARIALAELRTSEPSEMATVDRPSATADVKYPNELPNAMPGEKYYQAPVKAFAPKHVSITSPRAMAASHTFDPESLGGKYLDATTMPDTVEILVPPSRRSFADFVRVDNLTIAGAAQTLDGIRWRDVTFIGTRVRYDAGDLDLQNVRFVRCRFVIPSDERGGRLANAVALGITSIKIE